MVQGGRQKPDRGASGGAKARACFPFSRLVR